MRKTIQGICVMLFATLLALGLAACSREAANQQPSTTEYESANEPMPEASHAPSIEELSEP